MDFNRMVRDIYPISRADICPICGVEVQSSNDHAIIKGQIRYGCMVRQETIDWYTGKVIADVLNAIKEGRGAEVESMAID